MIIKKVKILNQINRWKSCKLVECHVQINDSTPLQLKKIDDFFATHLPDWTWNTNHQTPEKYLGQTFITLQNALGISTDYFEIKPKCHDEFILLFCYVEAPVIEKLMDFVKALINDSYSTNKSHQMDAFNEIKHFYENYRLGPSTGHIVEAALKKNIPYIRLNDESLVQLGHGAKQRRILAAMTDGTSAISSDICQDKLMTKKILSSYGIPMPQGMSIFDELDAEFVAERLGYPVAVKPLNGNQGKGVTTGIYNASQLNAAVQIAKQFEEEIIIEQHIDGLDYRLLVVGKELVACAQRQPPCVTGDGQQTIRELIENLNRDPRRMIGHNGVMSQILIDDVVLQHLASLNLNLDSILAAQESVSLRQNANLSTGGHAIDVTELVHPTVAAMAIKIAQALNIDICGIDLVCKDISKPLTEQNGAFIEVNLAPGLRMHIAPTEGPAHNVGEKIINLMFPNDDGRIPIITVTGTNGKTTTCQIIARVLQAYQFSVGLSCTEGIYIQNKKLVSGDCSGPVSAETILMHPKVNACVFETARGGILRKGLGFDKADVAIITNIGHGDHLGIENINHPEELLEVKSCILKSVRNGVMVFNADDDLLMKKLYSSPGRKILFSMNPDNPYIQQHIQQHQAVVYYEKPTQSITLQQDQYMQKIIVNKILLTHQGKVPFQMMNLMAAISGIWGLGLDLEPLSEILYSLESKEPLINGRFNVIKHHQKQLIIDYGHNLDAIHALLNCLDHFPAKRKIILTSSPGDRKNEIILQQMEAIGNYFDEAIVFQEDNLRNRQDGEVLSLIVQGLEKGRQIKKIIRIPDEQQALAFTLEYLQDDDFCLLILDNVEKGLQYIHHTLTIPMKNMLSSTV